MKHTELFLLRLWAEQESDGTTAWCGKVQRPVSGETHPFRTLPALTELLLSMLLPTLPVRSGEIEEEEE